MCVVAPAVDVVDQIDGAGLRAADGDVHEGIREACYVRRQGAATVRRAARALSGRRDYIRIGTRADAQLPVVVHAPAFQVAAVEERARVEPARLHLLHTGQPLSAFAREARSGLADRSRPQPSVTAGVVPHLPVVVQTPAPDLGLERQHARVVMTGGHLRGDEAVGHEKWIGVRRARARQSIAQLAPGVVAPTPDAVGRDRAGVRASSGNLLRTTQTEYDDILRDGPIGEVAGPKLPGTVQPPALQAVRRGDRTGVIESDFDALEARWRVGSRRPRTAHAQGAEAQNDQARQGAGKAAWNATGSKRPRLEEAKPDSHGPAFGPSARELTLRSYN